MSGYANISAVPDQNILYNAASGHTLLANQNQLLQNQGAQQDIGIKDMATVGQAGAALLGMSEDDASRAYGPMRDSLQAQGFGKNLPATYPGHAATQAFVQRAMPILQQIQTGFLTTPGSADATKRLNDIYMGGVPPATTSTGGGTGATAPATSGTVEPDALTRAQAIRDGLIKRGLDVDTATGFAANALHESGANPNVGAGDAGASHGTFQWNADRLARYQAINGHPPDGAPLDEQLDFVVHELGTTEGAARDRIAAAQGPAGKAAAISQYYLRPKDVQAEIARRSGTATQLASQWGAAGTSTGQPVITGDSLASSGGLGGSGVVGDSSAKVLARVQAESRAGKYDGKPVVLSTGASNDFGSDLGSVEQQLREAQGGNASRISVLGVGPAVEAKAPGTNAKLQALATSYGATFVPLPADQMSPDGVHPTAQGYATLKTAIAPAQGAPGGGGQPGRYQVASNAPVPPPASTVSAPGQPAAVATAQQPPVPQPPANRVMPGAADGPPAPVAQPAAPRANLPHAADVPQGLNSPQIQQAQRLQQAAAQIEVEAARNPFDKRLQADAAAKAADLKQRAQILMQSDSVVQTQEGQLHVATGVIDKPVPHFVWDEKQGAYVDTTGSTAPVTPPSPRISVVPGVGALQSKPGGGAELLTQDIRKPALDALAADRPKIDEITQNGQAAQQAMLRLNEMSDIIPRLATGPSADLRTRGAAWLEQLGASPETIKRYTGMESGSLAEELIKLSIATAGQAAKTDVGSNNGIQSLQLYQSANPGMALLPDANKRMTNMARVYQQMSQDYTQGALAHFNPQQQAVLNPSREDLLSGHISYSPISNYNQSWQERNNPQIGAATMGILNGDTFDKWAARATPEQAAAAVAMAARIDPNVRVPTKDGLKPASVILAHPMTPAGR